MMTLICKAVMGGAMLLLASHCVPDSAKAQQPDTELRGILESEAEVSSTLRISLTSGDSLQGLYRGISDSVLFLENGRIPLASIQSVKLRSFQGDPVTDKAVLGGIGGGIVGLIWPLFAGGTTTRDGSTQLALSVVGFAALGGGIAALIDAAVGREVTWRELWPRAQ